MAWEANTQQPEEKLNMAARKVEPRVGIVFLVNGRLYLESTPVSRAEEYGRFRVHSKGHDVWWDELCLDGEYQDWPRGRSQFDTASDHWTLLLDRCIIREPGLVQEILRQFRLPASTTTVGLDDHYRCSRCLRGC